jgi:hypothetical protein
MFCFIFGITYTQEVKQFQFNVLRYNDSVRLESCIPMNLYNERMILPSHENLKRHVMEGIPMHVVGSKWINNCLLIHWPNISNEEIISYLKEFTKLTEEQIILTE